MDMLCYTVTSKGYLYKGNTTCCCRSYPSECCTEVVSLYVRGAFLIDCSGWAAYSASLWL
uniref:Uncharacterized protein n=1 Tax=Solanum tuberosum TaxID=4113 RepID=M1D724_SOLTU